jgi:molecular chaperone GrpE (heat shock protein)
VTLAGKILTALTLVLSIMFAGLAVAVFATHKNWRDEAASLEKSLGALKASNQRLTEDIDQFKNRLAREQMARKLEIAALETELLQSDQQLTPLRWACW